jgi:excisionase family DNA binding protein
VRSHELLADALAAKIARAVADAVADIMGELLADVRADTLTTPTVGGGIDALPAIMPLWPTAGQFLGLSRTLTYDAARRSVLPTIRVGKKLLVSRDALAGWLATSSAATPRDADAAPVPLPRRAAR